MHTLTRNWEWNPPRTTPQEPQNLLRPTNKGCGPTGPYMHEGNAMQTFMGLGALRAGRYRRPVGVILQGPARAGRAFRGHATNLALCVNGLSGACRTSDIFSAMAAGGDAGTKILGTRAAELEDASPVGGGSTASTRWSTGAQVTGMFRDFSQMMGSYYAARCEPSTATPAPADGGASPELLYQMQLEQMRQAQQMQDMQLSQQGLKLDGKTVAIGAAGIGLIALLVLL